MTQRWIATSQNCKLRLIVRARSPRPICGKLERQSSPSFPEKCERVTGAGTPGAWVCHLRTTPNQRPLPHGSGEDRKSTRLNSSHGSISYAVFCLKKKRITTKINNNRQCIDDLAKNAIRESDGYTVRARGNA